MAHWGEITPTCARWFSSYPFLEALILVCAIVEIYIFAGFSIFLYCASDHGDPCSRLSVCYHDYVAQTPTAKWLGSFNMLIKAVSAFFGLYFFVGRMQRARWTRRSLEARPADLLQLTGNKLYTQTEIQSLVVLNKKLMMETEASVVQSERLVVEQEALVVEQDALVSELATWVSKVSALVVPLSNSMVTQGNKQTGEGTVPFETEQQHSLVAELAAVSSKLSVLMSKQIDLEETKKKERAERAKRRTKTPAEEYLRIETEKIETGKAKLEEDRKSLEAEKEALKAKAKKLGIGEDKLRTTTPGEFQKLIEIQKKLYNDLDKLHDEIKTPSNDKNPEEIARLARDFRVKTKETLLSMNANDKLIEDAWNILDSMECITPDIQENANWGYYWMKAVAGLFADHIVEDELRVVEGLRSQEGLRVEEGTRVGEMVQEQSQVKEAFLDETRPQEKEVLQVGDGLQ